MQFTATTAAAILATLATLAAASPVAGNIAAINSAGAVLRPIQTEPVAAEIIDGASLESRAPRNGTIRPIQAEPVFDEDIEDSLSKRDRRLKCGPRGRYTPVAEFNPMVEAYCNDAVGVDIAQGFEHTNSYDVLTTAGNPARVVFVIQNRARINYSVDYTTCVVAMQKSSVSDSVCYGRKNKDTRGGSWRVDGLGHFNNWILPGALTP